MGNEIKKKTNKYYINKVAEFILIFLLGFESLENLKQWRDAQMNEYLDVYMWYRGIGCKHKTANRLTQKEMS